MEINNITVRRRLEDSFKLAKERNRSFLDFMSELSSAELAYLTLVVAAYSEYNIND